jgi:rsbT co-antagonist protein RsbR
MAAKRLRTIELLSKYHAELVEEWTKELEAASDQTLASKRDVRGQAEQFLRLLLEAGRSGSLDVASSSWAAVCRYLNELSAERSAKRLHVGANRNLYLSLKRPMFSILRRELAGDANALTDEIWIATELVDKLGLETVSAFQRTRDEMIVRQQQELLELSTPVVSLWEGILGHTHDRHARQRADAGDDGVAAATNR